MDLQMTAAQQELRADLRAWLVTNLPWEYGTEPPTRSQDLAEVVAFGRHWQSMLAQGLWVGVTWPEELGGRGLGSGRDRGSANGGSGGHQPPGAPVQ